MTKIESHLMWFLVTISLLYTTVGHRIIFGLNFNHTYSINKQTIFFMVA